MSYPAIIIQQNSDLLTQEKRMKAVPLSEFRRMPKAKLEAEFDGSIEHVLFNNRDILDELARREMVSLTRSINVLTWVIVVCTLVMTAAAVVPLFR